MRTGLLTFTCANNFGAILQNYALESFFREQFKELDLRTVDYFSESIFSEYDSKRVKLLELDSPLGFILFFPRFFSRIGTKIILKKKDVSFSNFKRKYLHTTRKFNDKYDLKKVLDEFDIIITGSDQIFNKKITKDDYDVYSLKLFDTKIRKIAYGASVGSISNIDNEVLEDLINFPNLSCREKSLMDFVSPYGKL